MSASRFIRLATPEEAAAFWGQPVPDGYEAQVYAEDEQWRVRSEDAPPRKCRGKLACQSPPVAEMNRRPADMRSMWWAYCAEHMYGRWIEGGRVVGCRLRPSGAEGGER